MNKGPFKVALVSLGQPTETIPDWVETTFETEGVNFTYKECLTKDQIALFAGDADVVWVNSGSDIVNAETLPLLKRCGAVIRTGSGTDNIDVDTATNLGIVVTNTPGAHDDEVSEHTIALLLSLVRLIPLKNSELRHGVWMGTRTDAQTQGQMPNHHIHGQTLGLIGFGHVSQLVARKMSGFKMTILCHDPYVSSDSMSAKGVSSASLDDVLEISDFISLHCPLTDATRGLIGERELRLMKRKALLINTSRGPVIQESALIRALREGWISGAGLDVFEEEPTPKSNPLLTMDNVICTPHIAGQSDLMQEKQWRLSVESAIQLSKGHWPKSYVNPSVKPRWKLTHE